MKRDRKPIKSDTALGRAMAAPAVSARPAPQAASMSVDPSIKKALRFSETTPDATVYEVWKAASTRVCKPCWELRYCPYGGLVEQFPLLPATRKAAQDHNDYLTECLRSGTYGEKRSRLDAVRRGQFEKMVAEFNAADHPEKIPAVISDMSCRVFGHICPVVFSAEAFTETTEPRRLGRTNIPAHVLLRVARRDNYMCQYCHTALPDHQIEFDHRIPIAKGGSSDEGNLQVTCFSCNRAKGKRVVL